MLNRRIPSKQSLLMGEGRGQMVRSAGVQQGAPGGLQWQLRGCTQREGLCTDQGGCTGTLEAGALQGAEDAYAAGSGKGCEEDPWSQ